MIACKVPKGLIRGKSGLHRAGCRVTPGEGDFKESATEIYRLIYEVRVER
ncbi:hypothetical protein Bccel_0729 [Pseudobacteroides cellulosolvens ATCC 35603 = DSM 2933]|uniref:Uncharacterized protein n=1 Tax=Pseudobacteroides cellulosolvens ATCC 35603 = DSM 2933 TaxID=398512 RepID=A0A0L6JIA7_9FIRM|nr:hypothetical protein Bccel_0729 [Pseudobacteroides cellulosolvens ATCC 35603 = DSM 2933]